MNRTVRMLRNGFALLLLVALAAGAAWLITQSRPRPEQAAGSPLPTPTAVRSPTPSRSPSPTARQPGPPASPTPAATQVARRVPFCTFPGGPPPGKGGPSLNQYEFAEPQVIITDTLSLSIADWLSDSQRLLIMRQLPQNRERIEAFDIRSGEVRVYAERLGIGPKPTWLPAIQGVAYTSYDGPQWERYELRVSRGDSQQIEVIAFQPRGISLAVEPGGRQLWYLSDLTGGRPQVWDSVTRATQAAAFNVTDWLERPHPRSIQLMQFRWSPNGVRLALFTYPALFLVEPDLNRVCEVNLGSQGEQGANWPFDSQWSPNGRYLAMVITTFEPGELMRSGALVVLDTLTGEQHRYVLRPSPVLVTDMTWSTDNRHMMALGRTEVTADGVSLFKLFLVDIITGDVRLIWPDRSFGGGGEGKRMAWSPNGRELAIECTLVPTSATSIAEARVCLVSIQHQR